MFFKQEISMVLVLKREKGTDRFSFLVGGARIPSVREKPIESLR